MNENAESRPAATDLDNQRERIGATFRNGSVTAIGVVLAFSLGFLNTWASQPSSWIPQDLGAIVLIAAGIGFQIWSLLGILSVRSLEVDVYARVVKIFAIGLLLVSLGVLLAIGGDALSYGRKLMKTVQ